MSLITPSGVILQIDWRLRSITYTLSWESTAMLEGLDISAWQAMPSPGMPLPDLLAKVVTLPEGVILRIATLPQSPIYRLPCESTATPVGSLNLAADPMPSV